MGTLTTTDISRILRGAQILGCGGGGEISWGTRLIQNATDRGKEFRLEIPDLIEDDPVLSIIGAVGGGVSQEVLERISPRLEKLSLEEQFDKPIIRAIQELSAFTGCEPDGFIPTEIGAGNMAVSLFAAAIMDKYVIDGDCCGRAKPMISISTTRIAGINQTPMSVVNSLGDVMILKEAGDDEHTEDICRQFAVVSGGTCFCARCMAKLSEYRNGMIPGSFTRCLNLGIAMEQAQKTGIKAVEALMSVEKQAKILFTGQLVSHEKQHDGGFITGWLTLQGTGDFTGISYQIWFKNEFLAAFLNWEPDYRWPDLICVLNEDEYRGVSNWDDFEESTWSEISVIGIPSHPIWKTEKGANVFSVDHVLQHFKEMNMRSDK